MKKLAWLIPALLVFLHQLIFARYLSPTIAYELIAAQRVWQGQMPFRDFYFDDLPLLACLRVPEVLLGQILQMSPLDSLSSWLAASHGSMLGALPCATGIVLAHLLCTWLVQFLSLTFCFVLIEQSKLTSRALTACRVLLVALTVAQLAAGFSSGSLQHLAFLLMQPFLCLIAIDCAEGVAVDSVRSKQRWLAALLCGIAGALSIKFLALPLVLYLARALLLQKWSALQNRPALVSALLPFLALTSLFVLDSAAWHELTSWIITLKLTNVHFENMMTFGNNTSPDRREIIYALTVVVMLAAAMQRHRATLVPLIVVSMYGFVLFICSVQLLSDQCGLLTLSCVTALFYQIAFAFYSFGDHYPRLLLGRAKWVKSAAICIALVLFCPFLFAKEFFEIARIKTAIKIAPTLGFVAREDLRAAILRFSNAGDSIIVQSGRLTPGCSESLLTGRRLAGYFISYEAFGALNNLLGRHADGTWLGQPKEYLSDLDVKLSERLMADVAKYQPAFFMLEGGEMEMLAKNEQIYARILDSYYQGEVAQYFSTCEGPREYSDWNYDFYVMRR